MALYRASSKVIIALIAIFFTYLNIKECSSENKVENRPLIIDINSLSSNNNLNRIGALNKISIMNYTQVDLDIIEKLLSLSLKSDAFSDRLKRQSTINIDKDRLFLNSLIYFNKDQWNARINGYIVSEKSNWKITNEIGIGKVYEDGILFILLKTDAQKASIVDDIIKSKVSYYTNYHIIRFNDKDYIAIKLFSGQNLNMKTLQIKDR